MTGQTANSLFWYRIKLVALVVVFVSPFVAGWVALYVLELRPPSGNYGTLVQPVRKIDWPALETVDGEYLADGFARKWAFILFSDDGCGSQCRNNLYYMRQIRTLLGRDSGRLRNLLISARPLDEDLRAFLAEYPDLAVIADFRDDSLRRQFELPGAGAVGAAARMYLVDPDRNLMMHYPPQSDEARVLEDLKKLMKLSRIG